MQPYKLLITDRILETERFYLRRFILDDAPFLYHLSKNENVMKYTNDTPFKNIKASENFVKNYTHYDNYKMGRWAICDKKQGEFMGWCGLQYNPENDIVDIDYRIVEKHWNKNIATEVIKTVLLYAFNSLYIESIYAFADTKNTVFNNVILNSGLQMINETVHHKKPRYKYKIKNTAVQVKKITTKETYAIRQQVLRPTKTIDDCKFIEDNNSETFHLGLFYYGSLAGIVTYIKTNNPEFKTQNQYQLRGMAMDVRFQGKKLGVVLLKKAEQILKNKKVELLWCNARKKAINFYTRSNFITHGSTFEIPKIGTHIVMYKMFKNNIEKH